MEKQKDLPKPQTDFPLPEKEIPAKQTSKSSIFTSKFFILFVVISSVIAFLIGGFVLGKNQTTKPTSILTANPATTWKTYSASTFSIKYPESYQLNINKIVATEGIVENQENTIQLISPILPNTNGDLSIIIAYKPTKLYLEQAVKQGSTCAELTSTKLEPVKIGDYTFSQSGLINCGPNAVAFFYIENNGNIYEAKVETTADYNKDALPIVKQILATLKFTNSSPTPTCRPRPSCFDTVPRCMMPVTDDMCPPSPTTTP
jgi:hypothetical protein